MSEISTKEQIIKFKDYADIADASYAMLHWVSENEKNGLDDLYSKVGKENAPEKIVNSYKEQEVEKPVWRYADGIKKGDEITEDNQTKQSKINNRNSGDPTAYALTIEARFNQDMVIEKPKKKDELKPKTAIIDNRVQNFIDIYEDEEKTPYIFYKNISLVLARLLFMIVNLITTS